MNFSIMVFIQIAETDDEGTFADENGLHRSLTRKDRLMIYFISLVGSDAGDIQGKGLPRKALSFFDVKSEMEFEDFDSIRFLSVQDLLNFYEKETGKSGTHLNCYQLSIFFIQRNLDALYLLDEVPFMTSGKISYLIWKFNNSYYL